MQVCEQLTAGAGAVLIAEEAVHGGDGCLAEWLGRQPPWSDLPVLILARAGANSVAVARAMEELGNVTVLERPARVAALVSVVRTALRARQRQYQLRDQLVQRERPAEHLKMTMEAEERLRASEDRFRLAAEAVNGIIYEYDITTGHVERQRGLYEVLGYRAAEVPPTAAWWREQIHPDDLAVIEPQFMELAGNSITSEYRVRHRDGRWLHVEDRAVLQRGDDGRPARMVGCTVDVTDRKDADDQLRHREQLHRVAFDQSPTGMAYVGTDGRFIKVNPTMCEIAGYPAEELVGMTVSDITHPDDRARDAELVTPFLRGGTPTYENDKRYVRKDGGVCWVSITARMVTDAEGRPLHSLGVVVDITERKQAEERLRLAIGGADLGTWHWNLGTGALDWSERCLNIFGIPPRTAMSYEKFLGALHPEDRARADDAVQHALQNGSEYRIELRSVWPDGSVHWAVSVGRAYYDAAGVPTRMEGVALDITEFKRAEERRRDSERNYRALAVASSEIAYRMSADWSTMLPLDGRQLVPSSDQPLADWAWLDRNLPRDEHPRVRQAISEAIARKTLFELEHRVRRPDGSIGWTLSRAVPILDEKEAVIEWFGAASDVTERKQAQQALADRTELLNGVLEGTTDAIFVKDLNGRLLLANATCAALARSTPEQLVGKTDEELFPPDVAAAIRQLDKAVIAGGSPIQLEESIPVAGEPRVFLTLKAPLRDGGGRVVGVLGISRDITESKRAEETLRQSEARFRAAINAVSDIVWTNDAQGQMAGEQAAWGKFTGQNQESYQGSGWSQAIHPDDAQPTIDAWNEAVAGKQPFEFEHRLRRSDGQWRLCSVRAVPVLNDREIGRAHV